MAYTFERDAADVMFTGISAERKKQIDFAIYKICRDITANGEDTKFAYIYEMLTDHIDENGDHYLDAPVPETSP